MQPDFRAALVFLSRRVLHPLVRILVRFGVSAGELKAIVDSVYAHAGSEYLTRQGERVTYSRLAVITGINRSFLPAILATPQDRFQPRSNTQLHRAARVLNGWYDDVHFQTRTGEPALLQITGQNRSFQQLAERYSGGVYYQTLLSELVRVGAVKRVGGDHVRALRRSLSAGGASAEALVAAGESAGDLLQTLEHNLTAHSHEQLPIRSLVLPVDARSLPLFRAQVARRSDALMEVIETFGQAHRPDTTQDGAPSDRSDTRAAAKDQTLMLGATVFAVCRNDAPSGPQPKPTLRKTASGRRIRRR
ncbi:MAG TPA: DUF6502 family protein [Steroidobacteraceae bacterium]|nr:DUF6502 family protein [Steroidobacteraceae bacterium]